ncbi:hypothetical protein ACFUIW_16410 [Streptomyces sp. NPDC057245]|uniref:hypothetical protein n=1 Tax=Streptomyces sp. NPDC057245 TaxID=3346065 RepID=UPI003635AC47
MHATRILPVPILALSLFVAACGPQEGASQEDKAKSSEPSTQAQAPSASPSTEEPSADKWQWTADTIQVCANARMSVRAKTLAVEIEESGKDTSSSPEEWNMIAYQYSGAAEDALFKAQPEAQAAVRGAGTREQRMQRLDQWCLGSEVVDEKGTPVEPPPGYEPP